MARAPIVLDDARFKQLRHTSTHRSRYLESLLAFALVLSVLPQGKRLRCNACILALWMNRRARVRHGDRSHDLVAEPEAAGARMVAAHAARQR